LQQEDQLELNSSSEEDEDDKIDDGLWQGQRWQQTLLQPITDIMKMASLQCCNEKLLALRSIEKII